MTLSPTLTTEHGASTPIGRVLAATAAAQPEPSDAARHGLQPETGAARTIAAGPAYLIDAAPSWQIPTAFDFGKSTREQYTVAGRRSVGKYKHIREKLDFE